LSSRSQNHFVLIGARKANHSVLALILVHENNSDRSLSYHINYN